MATDSADPAERESEAWAATPPAKNWRPPRAGSMLAVLIVAVGCYLLADALGALDSLSVAAVGAAGLGGVVWLLGRERYATVGTLLGVAVAPLAGGLLFVGVSYALIAQLAGFAPQGTVFVALSVALAGFGAASVPGDSVDRESVKSAARGTVLAAFVLVAVAGSLVANVARREEGIEPFEALPLPEGLPELFPEMLVPPVGSVLLVLSLSLLALRAALTALPVAELLDDRAGGDDAVLRWFERLLSGLGTAGAVGAVVGITLVAARVLLGPAYLDFWATLPPLVDGLLRWFGTAELLRWASIRLLVVGVAIVALVRLIRRVHQSGLGKHLGKIAVLLGVALALAVGWVAHEAILDVLLTRLEGALPGVVAEAVLEQVDTVIDYYSGEIVTLGVVALGGLTAALALGLLRLGTLLRLVPGRHGGHALASGGLLATAGFAAALDAPILYALGSIVGAVVVWDLGRFGVSLGRDVGRRAPSLPVQFVRVLTAALVGGVTAALGLAAASTTASVSLATESAAALALFVAVGVTFLASLALAR